MRSLDYGADGRLRNAYLQSVTVYRCVNLRADAIAQGAEAFNGAVTRLLEFERIPDTVDDKIGVPGYVGVTTRGAFAPASVITDARQRWLFRLVHTDRPLQEKMALFWHNHFATGYSKIAGLVGATEATRYLAAKPSEDPGQVKGQLELFREMALGNFRDLLVAVARDTAMLFWLDGYTNTRTRPQENFGREIMELFTMGVGHYTEPDVYAAARVFTGWNLRLIGGNNLDPNAYYEFVYNAAQHEPTAKTFTFPIYRDGGRTIPARAAADGMQDGLDFMTALANHPETARRLARKLWGFFVSEVEAPPEEFVGTAAGIYLNNDTEMRPVLDYVLTSGWFQDARSLYARFVGS